MVPLWSLKIATQFPSKQLFKSDSCLCRMDFSAWDFPVQSYEEAESLVEKCQATFTTLREQVNLTQYKVPKISSSVGTLTQRVRQYEYLNKKGLYNALHFRQLDSELEGLETQIKDFHKNKAVDPSKTRELTNELNSVRVKVQSLQNFDKFNLLAMREHLRTLRNRLESCRTLDSNHQSEWALPLGKGRLLSNISSPAVTKLSIYGKSYPYGSWGRDNKDDGSAVYWVTALTSSNKYGNYLYTYPSHEDFMSSRNYQTITVTSSYSTTNAIQGPGSVLYKDAFYYNCYASGNICKYDLQTKTIISVSLPGAGYSDKFPYCYYSCSVFTDIDFATDEKGLWVIYATEENYGNVVVSKVNTTNLAVIQTWRTRLFKKSVTNTFMVCGVLYATRYVNTYQEEVFYAFDTANGYETSALKLPFEKVSSTIQYLNYSPFDQRLYLFNDGYTMAFDLFF
uniref:Olfactomedin-4-like n=1 Tax=Lepisosteus oculatus TaxID=7918 RepID=W5M6L8_LEPOC